MFYFESNQKTIIDFALGFNLIQFYLIQFVGLWSVVMHTSVCTALFVWDMALDDETVIQAFWRPFLLISFAVLIILFGHHEQIRGYVANCVISGNNSSRSNTADTQRSTADEMVTAGRSSVAPVSFIDTTEYSPHRNSTTAIFETEIVNLNPMVSSVYI